MSTIEVKVPNIGDFKNVEVIEVLVKEGQEVKKNDALITIESDKSSVEIPSSHNGKIKSLKLNVGDKVSEGDKILDLEAESSNEEKTEPQEKVVAKQETIVAKEDKKISDQKTSVPINFDNKNASMVLASPKARKFARELGIDINQIVGSERNNRVTEEDIKYFVASRTFKNEKSEIIEEKKTKKIVQEYSHSEFGEIEIKDIPRVKKLASNYLMNSWSSIPHVTNHDEADITEMEDFRSSLTDIYTGEKKKITPLAFIIKALVASLKKFPSFNSSIDEIENGKMTLKKYFHIGIAVDTPHGLMVPKIRNADNKSISTISKELKEVSDLCKNLKIDKKELFGGSMTITSLGGIGGSFFTPIINFPEVAILGIGKSEKKQIYINNKFETRTMLPISLSYDHRIIDGAEAARFNNDLKENLGKNFAYKLAV
ncbi:MAG: dihydrolipoamide acetyltransferase [Pelagibacteraceae bacterium BACL5 MAG-120705-bin12]|jgi:pyruvate dehydrogenase E2 component (dihydrolipoamide acetyltransferase)|nr:MAG: dihydrolipoamide acetyltransferase [Pelagibacteraceae bacterium BACL5 MAG-121128-bin54]KRO60444.1 MAG: dihydrolipoamide acetyltransferase [Pelagibacteraceae bacterium BACL5 MAG-120705-bin12]KRO65370.1 MAG: dihydrolipoamide acetyltransferase [Pelagibacteraceae bacterium BACL5 MAG-120820-bin39]